MRDCRFVAEHRGGPLSKENHRMLIEWAVLCSAHVLPLLNEDIDIRLIEALRIAGEWANGNATVGQARKASVNAHAFARSASDPVHTALARSVGHAVATAHMADHSLGAALYALRAVSLAGKSVADERSWQINHIPHPICDLVKSALQAKGKSFKI